jgi:3-deoxy-7-phosphoheptulonate synthase
MKPGSTQVEIEHVIEQIREKGLTSHLSIGEDRTVIGAVGDTHAVPTAGFEVLDGVESVIRISQPYKLASRQFHPNNSIFPLDGFTVGGDEIAIIAGPCSVESREQLLETALAVRDAGAHALRGGVFKPRTSPYSFQGLGEEGLEFIAEARQLTALPVVVEITSITQLDLMVKYVDVFQIGARNMQNFAL